MFFKYGDIISNILNDSRYTNYFDSLIKSIPVHYNGINVKVILLNNSGGIVSEGRFLLIVLLEASR